MSASTIAAEVEKAVAELRIHDEKTVEVHYVNDNDVPVKRRIHIGAELVDGAALSSGRAA